MNPPRDDHWVPTPEMLTAFADRELDCRPQLAELRGRIQRWLESHPEAADDLQWHQELARLVAATRPPEPSPGVWAATWKRVVRAARPKVSFSPALRLAGLLGAGFAAALLLIASQQFVAGPTLDVSQSNKAMLDLSAVAEPQLAGMSLAPSGARGGQSAPEALEMVTADEIEIIFVAGACCRSLPIGRLPMPEPMVLAQVNDLEFVAPVSSDAHTELRLCGNKTPLVWTPLPSECKDGKKRH